MTAPGKKRDKFRLRTCFSKINVELIFYFNDLLTFLLTLYQPDIYESVARIYRKNTVNK